MNVLIIGPNYFNFLSAVKNAFVALGWDTIVCPYDNPVHPYTGLMRIRWKLSCRREVLLNKSRKIYNDLLKSRFLEEKSTLVFILNGDIVLSDTLDFFRQNGAKVALWMFDNLSKLPSAVGHVDHVDALFCFDPGDVKQYKKLGKKVFFLPQACDTAVYKRLPDVRKDIDILFVGNMYYSPKRRSTLLSVIKAFPAKKIVVFGLYQPWYKGIIKWLCRPYRHIFKNVNLSPEEVNYYYNRAKVVLNIHQESQTDGANPRVFEISGSGAYQICDVNPYIETLFPYKTIGLYNTIEDLIEQISFALANPGKTSLSGIQAERVVLDKHSFECRVAEMLSYLGIVV